MPRCIANQRTHAFLSGQVVITQFQVKICAVSQLLEIRTECIVLTLLERMRLICPVLPQRKVHNVRV